MEYVTIHQNGPVHVARVTPLTHDVVRLSLSIVIPDVPHTWNRTIINFYADLLLTGTAKRSKADIETYLKKYGITLSVRGEGDTITFSVVAERAQFGKALTLLTELITEPRFDRTEFKLRKQMLLEENREAHDNAKRIAEINFVNTLYPAESYFRAPTLTEEHTHITAVTPARLTKLHEATRTGEWYLTLVGSEHELRALSTLIRTLERTARAVPPPDSHTLLASAQGIYTTVPGKTNVEVRIGNILPITGNDDDYIPFSFGLKVLGKVGGFAGRLMSVVREKEGLTYGIYARTANLTNENSGHWNVFTFFTANDLARGIESTIREITSIVREGITEDELVRFKAIIHNQERIVHGSDAGRLSFYHNMLLNHETPARVQSDMERTATLTTTNVHAALQKYIDPNQLVIAGAGPVTKDGKGIVR